MQLTVIGCHGPYPAAGCATTGYLLTHQGKHVLIDCGSGVLSRLLERIDPAKLEAVLLSHLHFDHASDMLVLRYYLERVGACLPVYIPWQGDSPLRPLLTQPAFDLRPIEELTEIAGMTLRTLSVRHPVETRAMRFEAEGKALVYTADTGDSQTLLEFAKDADVLLADAAFVDAQWNNNLLLHMTARHTALLAMDAGAKRLLLTHLSPANAPEVSLREAQEVFPAAQIAAPGKQIIV